MQDLTLEELGSGTLEPFMELLGEIEGGEHYSHADPKHIAWLTERLDRHLGRGVRFFGSRTRGGDVLGLVALLVERGLSTGTTAEITHIGTARSHRRVGVGTRLLQRAIDMATQEGAPALFVRTYAADTANVAFYGCNAFHPVAVIPGTNGPDDEGTIVMRRRLTGTVDSSPSRSGSPSALQ